MGGVTASQTCCAAQDAFDLQCLRIVDFVSGGDEWADRAETVEDFAAYPLAVDELQVARRHIVQAGVTEDINCSKLPRELSNVSYNDEPVLCVEVDLLPSAFPFSR